MILKRIPKLKIILLFIIIKIFFLINAVYPEDIANIKLEFFYNSDCGECLKTVNYLLKLKAKYKYILKLYDIGEDIENISKLKEFYKRFNIEPKAQNTGYSLFMENKYYLSADDIENQIERDINLLTKKKIKDKDFKKDKLALLIGINQYADKSLFPIKGAENDVKKIRGFLKNKMNYKEYEITELTNKSILKPNYKNIIIELNKLKKNIEESEIKEVFIYFSGHGYNNYWLSSDYPAGINLEDFGINILQKVISKFQNKEFDIYVVSDACRLKNENLISFENKDTFNIVANNDNKHILYISSCSSGEISCEMNNNNKWNGIFTNYFVSELSKSENINKELIIDKIQTIKYIIKTHIEQNNLPEMEINIIEY